MGSQSPLYFSLCFFDTVTIESQRGLPESILFFPPVCFANRFISYR